MARESTTSLCPRCHNKLIWNGTTYRCIACDFMIVPKLPKKKQPPRK
ncbi:MAG TPA: hypothetical protein VF950_09705 [Planctomycetota bacterium]